MPRIKLKPNSAEYADNKVQNKKKRCEMPGCSNIAEHKAPKHRGLNEYHNFCIDHVREYNKAWNYFSGMSDTEVNDHMNSARYGHRPTWQYTAKGAAEDILRRQAWQAYNFTDPKSKKNGNDHDHINGASKFDTPELKSMMVMGLEPPVTLEEIKERYKMLAKEYHPDLNQGCSESEELLKQINMAYTILKLAYKQFEKLPKRD